MIRHHAGCNRWCCDDDAADADAGAWIQEGVCSHSWHLPQAWHSRCDHGEHASDTTLRSRVHDPLGRPLHLQRMQSSHLWDVVHHTADAMDLSLGMSGASVPCSSHHSKLQSSQPAAVITASLLSSVHHSLLLPSVHHSQLLPPPWCRRRCPA